MGLILDARSSIFSFESVAYSKAGMASAEQDAPSKPSLARRLSRSQWRPRYSVEGVGLKVQVMITK
jgi:hypothetical protein